MPLEQSERPNFYERSLRASVAIGVLATLFISVYGGPFLASAYTGPLAWMLLNLALWRRAVREILGRRRSPVLFPLVALKVLWLGVMVALAGVLEVGADGRRLAAFLLGFNTPFLVMSLKAAGGMLVSRSLRSSRGHHDVCVTDRFSDR